MRAWTDTDKDGVLDITDEFDFVHYGFRGISGGAANDRIISADDYSYLKGRGGDDYLQLGNKGGQIYGSSGNDILIGGEGGDFFDPGPGIDAVNGGGGSDTMRLYLYYAESDLTIDLTKILADPARWKQNDDGAWQEGTGEGFIWQRIWSDVNANQIEDEGDSFDYFTNIEEFSIYGGKGDDRLTGSLNRDQLYGGDGDDILAGNAGNDILHGGNGADTFVLNRNGTGEDFVWDFDTSEGDRVRVDTATGKETTLAALGLSVKSHNGDTQIVNADDPSEVYMILNNISHTDVINNFNSYFEVV